MLANVAPSAAAVVFPSMSSSAMYDVVTAVLPGMSYRIEAADPLVERDVAVVGHVTGEAQNPFRHEVLEHLGGPTGDGEARRPAQSLRPSVGACPVGIPGHRRPADQIGPGPGGQTD